MKRDFDLIKQILIALEERDDHDIPLPLQVPEYSIELVDYHLKLLMDANYILAKNTSMGVYPIRLTNNGHDFLDVARNDSAWNKAKHIIKEKAGSVTLDILKEVLSSVVKASLGLP